MPRRSSWIVSVVFVGTFNLDPRSAWLDTQNGIVVRSETLAGQAAHLFEENTTAETRLQGYPPDKFTRDGGLTTRGEWA